MHRHSPCPGVLGLSHRPHRCRAGAADGHARGAVAAAPHHFRHPAACGGAERIEASGSHHLQRPERLWRQLRRGRVQRRPRGPAVCERGFFRHLRLAGGSCCCCCCAGCRPRPRHRVCCQGCDRAGKQRRPAAGCVWRCRLFPDFQDAVFGRQHAAALCYQCAPDRCPVSCICAGHEPLCQMRQSFSFTVQMFNLDFCWITPADVACGPQF